MKRCEREWEPARARAVQAIVRNMCGRCLCENGEQCPLFAYKDEPVQAGHEHRHDEVMRVSA